MEADVIDRDRRIAGGLRLADGTAEPADANDAGGREDGAKAGDFFGRRERPPLASGEKSWETRETTP